MTAGSGASVTTLRDLLPSLGDVDEELVVVARRPWTHDSDATCVDEDVDERPSGLEYLLEVGLVREVARVWSAWRDGREPTPTELADAVVHYAEHDTYLPTEWWSLLDRPDEAVDADALAEVVAGRAAAGTVSTWLTSSQGRRLGLVSNGSRAMVLLLDHDGDPGEHAVDPDAGTGSSDGYVLENGQVDEYPDQDTVPVDEAVRIVAHVLAHGAPPGDAGWQVDR